MSKLFKIMIPLSLVAVAMTGCVVAPAGYYHRGYYGPRVAVVAPAPVVVVQPTRNSAVHSPGIEGYPGLGRWREANGKYGLTTPCCIERPMAGGERANPGCIATGVVQT